MIDIHSHILPGIDDGAKNIKESLALLNAEIINGIDTVVLTPHFYTNMTDLETFLTNRQHAYEMLRNEAAHLPIRLMLGAEVSFSTHLLEFDITPLCIGGTKHILIELPTGHYPLLTKAVLYKLRMRGITPVIAHVERCSRIMRNLDILEDFIADGVWTQINADSLLRGWQMRRKLIKLLKQGLILTIATDTHSLAHRPPVMREAMNLVEKKLGSGIVEWLKQNAESVVKRGF